MPPFTLITGPTVKQVLTSDPGRVVELVREAYLLHQHGETINPDSYFLRFPERPEARIIALPAYLGGETDLAGIKWISSFPKNIESGLPRASSVLILNDHATGYPLACLEAASISAARTAASAAIAATTLRPEGYQDSALAIIGGGVIARNIADYLKHTGVRPARFVVHDLDRVSGERLAQYLETALETPAAFTEQLDQALAAETIVLATTAGEPYIHTPLRPGQLVLNISLRDLAPEVILGAANILDDVEHCLKANTSAHLAEQRSGGREFVTGTLAQVMEGEVTVQAGQPVVFSPFGLGVLDLALGAHVLNTVRSDAFRSDAGSGQDAGAAAGVIDVENFFAESTRW